MGGTGRAGVRSGSVAGTTAYLIGGGASDGGADGARARRGAAEGSDVADRGRGEGQAHLTRFFRDEGTGTRGVPGRVARLATTTRAVEGRDGAGRDLRVRDAWRTDRPRARQVPARRIGERLPSLLRCQHPVPRSSPKTSARRSRQCSRGSARCPHESVIPSRRCPPLLRRSRRHNARALAFLERRRTLRERRSTPRRHGQGQEASLDSG